MTVLLVVGCSTASLPSSAVSGKPALALPHDITDLCPVVPLEDRSERALIAWALSRDAAVKCYRAKRDALLRIFEATFTISSQ